MARADRITLIKKIEEKRGSRVICCITSDRNNAQGFIAKDFLFRFFEHLRRMPLPDNQSQLEQLDVFFFTIGGDTLAAYALGRFVRQFAKKIGVLIPHTCHSGGTLFSLVADEITMTRVATLSSIDPSIVGQLNPLVEAVPGQRAAVPVGVESISGFRNTVREDWRLDEGGAARAFQLLAEKVHPLLLGDLYRAREQIIRLASTLLKSHMPEEDKIRSLVEALATGLGSHDYLIGKTEARDLFPNIAPDDAEVENMMWELYEDFAKEMELGIPFDPGAEIQAAQSHPQQGPIRKTLKIILIESGDRDDRWERELNIIPMGPVAQAQVLWNYWRQ